MLFLGGGNFSLRRDPVSAACLLLSMAPRFPQRTVDNQYHLQALRHLYVLAAEPRALHTIDVDSGLTVSVNVQVELIDGRILKMQAPGLLPELSTILRISVLSAESVQVSTALQMVQYYPTSIDLQKSEDQANVDLQDTGFTMRMQGTGPRCRSQEHITVPLLFVKQMPRTTYSYPPAVPLQQSTNSAQLHGEEQGLSAVSAHLQQLSIPRTFKDSHDARSPVSGTDTAHGSKFAVTTPAEKLAAMLHTSSSNANTVLGQALFEREPFLQLVLQSVIL